MRARHLLPLLLCLGWLSGCSLLQSGKILAPESFGLVQVTPDLYVEPGTDAPTRAALQEDIIKAESAVRAAYGSVLSRPVVHACMSEACYERFGGHGSIAKVYGDRILLSPRGLDWHFLAHEWSHAEIRTRLSLMAWWRMPQWFDEGVAVAVSEAPEHSESHWAFLVASGIPRPGPDELRTFKSLNQWLAAVHKYGEGANGERMAKGLPAIRPVYAAAGHEVRPWLAGAGTQGLLAFIGGMNNGDSFESAYQAANPPMPSTAPGTPSSREPAASSAEN